MVVVRAGKRTPHVKIVRYDDPDAGDLCPAIMECVDEPADEVMAVYQNEFDRYEKFIEELKENNVTVRHVSAAKDIPKFLNPTDKIPNSFSEVRGIPAPASKVRTYGAPGGSRVGRPTSQVPRLPAPPPPAPPIVVPPSMVTIKSSLPQAGSGRQGVSVAVAAPASTSFSVTQPAIMRLPELAVKVKGAVISPAALKDYTLLLVVCKPYFLRSEQATADRVTLDSKVKNLLVLPTAKFTEWLIKEQLARSMQYCEKHSEGMRLPSGVYRVMPQEMQLAVYSDSQKFPSTGGYVWISPCCPNRYVSVFRGSVFEGANAAPVVVLKLIYHWACQTNPTNVSHWVKVEYGYVDKFYRTMRALCTYQMVCRSPRLGGRNGVIEATAVTVLLQNKLAQAGVFMTFDLIGLYDRAKKEFRFRALIPTRSRSAAIRKVLSQYVHPASRLVIDTSLNHPDILQGVVSDNNNIEFQNPPGNKVIMTYVHAFLRQFLFEHGSKIRTLLDMQSILDELAWREVYGQTPLQAFEAATSQIASETNRLQDPNLMRSGRMEGIVTKLQAVQAQLGTDALYTQVPFSADEQPGLPVLNISATSTTSGSSNVSSFGSGRPGSAIDGDGRNLQSLLLRQQETSSGVSDHSFSKSQPPIKLTKQLFGSTVVPPAKPRQRAGPAKHKKRMAEADAAAAAAATSAAVETPSSFSSSATTFIDISEYYYATIEPNVEPKPDMDPSHYKCNLCQKRCESVFGLGLHVFMHLLGGNYSSEANEDLLCKYCLQSFPTDFALQNHVSSHQNSHVGTRCAICQEFFKSKISLIQHMVKCHNPSEMPFACSICPYRTSFHKAYIDHFEEKHGKADRALCNYCLRTFSIFPNLRVFVTHVQLHLQQKKKIRCKNCSLTFVNPKQQKAHKRDHISRAGQPEVIAFKVPKSEQMMMAKPSDEEDVHLRVYRSSDDHVTVDGEVVFVMKCLECNNTFNTTEHFRATYSCTHCTFESMCAEVAKEHERKCLLGGMRTQARKKKPALLPFKYYCPCGFNSNDGDKLAIHVGEDCEFEAVYESPEKAKSSIPLSATFPRLLNAEGEASEEEANLAWINAFLGAPRTQGEEQEKAQGVLGMVGLVRKRDRKATEDDESSTADSSETKRGRIDSEESSVAGDESSSGMGDNEESGLERGEKRSVEEEEEEDEKEVKKRKVAEDDKDLEGDHATEKTVDPTAEKVLEDIEEGVNASEDKELESNADRVSEDEKDESAPEELPGEKEEETDVNKVSEHELDHTDAENLPADKDVEAEAESAPDEPSCEENEVVQEENAEVEDKREEEDPEKEGDAEVSKDEKEEKQGGEGGADEVKEMESEGQEAVGSEVEDRSIPLDLEGGEE